MAKVVELLAAQVVVDDSGVADVGGGTEGGASDHLQPTAEEVADGLSLRGKGQIVGPGVETCGQRGGRLGLARASRYVLLAGPVADGCNPAPGSSLVDAPLAVAPATQRP